MNAGTMIMTMAISNIITIGPVSYTHLDVYKRQNQHVCLRNRLYGQLYGRLIQSFFI